MANTAIGPQGNPRFATVPAGGGYIDPLAGAQNVTPERIDQGVDYGGQAMIGTLKALGRGVVTTVADASQSGWPGPFVEYQLTDGPLKGQYVYYAEGIIPSVKQGQILNAGDTVAQISEPHPSGIELGFGSGIGTSSYAAQHGGYTEGHSTQAGVDFSNLVSSLGGPAGVKQRGSVQGTGPAAAGGTDPIATVGSAASSAASALTGAVDAAKAIGNFLSNPVPALLTLGLIALGAVLIFSGTGKMLGFDTPVRSAVQRVRTTAKAGAEAGE